MPNNLILPAASKSTSRSSSKGLRSRVQFAPLSFTPAVVTLLFGKASRVFAAFVSFHYLQDRVALPLYLFFVTLGAAVTLLLLQRPWNGKRIGSKRGRRVLLAGGFLAATLYIWTAGLRSAGPIRTLLIDGAELPLIYMFAVLTRRELPEKRKTRGAICMLLAYCLLIWDASGHVPDVREIEHSKFGQRAEHMVGRLTHSGWMNDGSERTKTVHGMGGGGGGNDELVGGFGVDEEGMAHEGHHGRRRLLTTFRPRVKGSGGMKDAFVEGTALRCEFGVILVMTASVLVQIGRGFSRRLAVELGGAKRHFALSMGSAVLWVTPLALLSWMSNSTGALLSLQAIGGITRMRVTTSHAIGFFAVGFLWLVLPFYIRAIVSTAVSSQMMMQASVVIPFFMAALAVSFVGGSSSAGGLSWVLLMAFLLECVGVSLMMAGGVKRGLSELPIDATPSHAGHGSMGGEQGQGSSHTLGVGATSGLRDGNNSGASVSQSNSNASASATTSGAMVGATAAGVTNTAGGHGVTANGVTGGTERGDRADGDVR